MGDWPTTGATVDLFLLRQAARNCPTETIDRHAMIDAVMLFGDHWRIRLNLLKFGPESDAMTKVSPPLLALGPEDLPLFKWALKRSQVIFRQG